MEPRDGEGGAPDLSVLQVSCGACVILIPLALSFLLDLGVTSQIFVGGSRTALQLSLLGYILSFIFDVDHPAIVLCYLSFMATAAAYEACSKAPKGELSKRARAESRVARQITDVMHPP